MQFLFKIAWKRYGWCYHGQGMEKYSVYLYLPFAILVCRVFLNLDIWLFLSEILSKMSFPSNTKKIGIMSSIINQYEYLLE